MKEINGRWACTDCGHEWSATAGDNEIPELCDCEWDSLGGSKFKLPKHPPWYHLKKLWELK